MKCVLVLLAAALCFCSFHAYATTAADIREGSFPKLNMRSNKLQEALPASTDSVTVTVAVTGKSAAAGNVDVTVIVKGTDTVAFTGTGSVTLTGATAVPLTIAAKSGDNCGKTVTGKINIKGTLTAADTVTGTGTVAGTLTGATAKSVSLAGTVTGTVTVTHDSATVNTVTVGGDVEIAKSSQVDAAPQGGKVGSGSLPAGSNTADGPAAAVASSTTTEAPETTTTSTAVPTEAPQQSTEKPTNPTEGKTDSSNSHVASHVALFIGTIAILSAV